MLREGYKKLVLVWRESGVLSAHKNRRLAESKKSRSCGHYGGTVTCLDHVREGAENILRGGGPSFFRENNHFWYFEGGG